MTGQLQVISCGQGVTVQDKGRSGYLAFGLSRGGAADRLAVIEGAALLRQSDELAVIEMAGMGGTFAATRDLRIALTGAPMRATIDGGPIIWNASHLLPAGAKLTIGGAERGCYGYLHVGGGLATRCTLGARAVHVQAGLGKALLAGDCLPLGADKPGADIGVHLPVDDRFDGGSIRILPSLQTAFFADSELDRFVATTFTRDTRGNRMGVRIVPDGAGFHSQAGLSVLSEVVVPGDVQVTGDGTPFVLLCECGTTGGYPRIGSVLPIDLPRVAQAAAGTKLRFNFITLDAAVAATRQETNRQNSLKNKARPLVRDPRDVENLLEYQLISGATAGNDLEEDRT